jgi:hypothetical protein
VWQTTDQRPCFYGKRDKTLHRRVYLAKLGLRLASCPSTRAIVWQTTEKTTRCPSIRAEMWPNPQINKPNPWEAAIAYGWLKVVQESQRQRLHGGNRHPQASTSSLVEKNQDWLCVTPLY